MPELAKMVAVLFVACGFSAGSLAVVNLVTRAPIAAWEKKQKEDALHEVFTDADEFLEVTPNRLWEARRQGQLVGHVFLAETQGYSGTITLMFGTTGDDAVTGLKVLGHTETPGLGARITGEPFRGQFAGKRGDQLRLRQEAGGEGGIDAITAATISSRAVTRAVSATLTAFVQGKGGQTP